MRAAVVTQAGRTGDWRLALQLLARMGGDAAGAAADAEAVVHLMGADAAAANTATTTATTAATAATIATFECYEAALRALVPARQPRAACALLAAVRRAAEPGGPAAALLNAAVPAPPAPARARTAAASPLAQLHCLGLDACARADDAEAAMQLLRDLVAAEGTDNAAGQHGAEAACVAAVASCARGGEWRTALEMVEVAAQRGSGSAARAVLLVVGGFGRCSGQQQGGGAAGAAGAVGGGSGEALRAGLDLLEAARRSAAAAAADGGGGVDVEAWEAGIAACTAVGDGARALRLLAELVGDGGGATRPRQRTFNLALGACCLPDDSRFGAPRWVEALVLLADMAASGVAPGPATYAAALQACEAAAEMDVDGAAAAAERVREQMATAKGASG